MQQRVFELCILRVTAQCRAEHEWGVHVAYFGKRSGLTASQVEVTVTDLGVVIGTYEPSGPVRHGHM